MTCEDLLARLRGADEDTVAAALDGAYVQPPLSDPVALLEFFNRMVDVLTASIMIPRE